MKIAACLLADAFRFVALLFRSTKSLEAENLVLRRQLALCMERGVRPPRIDAATRVSLAVRCGCRNSSRQPDPKRNNGSATQGLRPGSAAAARTVHIAPKRRHSRAEVGLKQPQSVENYRI